MATRVAGIEERIVRDPAVMAGKPVIRGSRIPVEKVLAQLAYSPDLGELLEVFPELTRDDVRACLAYAGRRLSHQRRSPSSRSTGRKL